MCVCVGRNSILNTTNSILADNANRAFQGDVAIQVTQSGQLWNQAMQGTSSDATLWPTLEPM